MADYLDHAHARLEVGKSKGCELPATHAKALFDHIATLTARVGELEAEKRTALDFMNSARRKLTKRRKRLVELSDRIATLERQLAETEKKIDTIDGREFARIQHYSGTFEVDHETGTDLSLREAIRYIQGDSLEEIRAARSSAADGGGE